MGVPALSRHGFDGHEAEFYDLFIGARAVNRGGTVLYPALQWLWAGLGSVLPHQPWIPVVLMSGVGAASVVVCADLARLLLRDPARPRRGLVAAAVAGAVVALHPVHAAWSSSAYNVILPFFFGCCVLWVGAQVGRSRQRRVATAGAAAWALVVATRLDAALVGLPAALFAVFLSPLDTPWRDGVRRRWVLVLPLVVGLGLGAAAALPLVYPGEVPGAGERELAFWSTCRCWSTTFPLAGLWVALLAVCAVAALREDAVLATVLLVELVANHLVMGSFDDLGDRHLLLAVPWLQSWLPRELRGATGRPSTASGWQVRRCWSSPLGCSPSRGASTQKRRPLWPMRTVRCRPPGAWNRPATAAAGSTRIPALRLILWLPTSMSWMPENRRPCEPVGLSAVVRGPAGLAVEQPGSRGSCPEDGALVHPASRGDGGRRGVGVCL